MRFFFDYLETRSKLDAAYLNCPVECVESPKYYDRTRRNLCQFCPRKTIEETFRCESESLAAEWLGTKARKFPFEDVKATAFFIHSLGELSKSEITVKTARLLETYRIEKHRHEVIKEADKKTE